MKILVLLLFIFLTACSEEALPVTVPEEPEVPAVWFPADLSDDFRVFNDIPENSRDMLDLAGMSLMMSSAAYMNIMADPENHLGQKIRTNGTYQSFFYEETGITYHFLFIEVPGCCPHNMEFILKSGEYPEEGTEFLITGVLGSYEEMGDTFYYLAVEN